MTLLAPWALWLSLVGLAVMALYLLKIRRRHQLVPALDLWLELVSLTQVRSLFQRLKRWLSLLLWFAIVGVIVLAVGNPVVTLGTIRPESIAVVVDNSASMQVVEETDQGRTRLELAIDAVRQMLARRPVHDEWMLIEAGRQPKVRQAWTRDRSALLGAAEAIAPSLVSGDLKGAVALADQLLKGKQYPRIVIVSDGAAGSIEQFSAGDPKLVYWSVGRTRDNLGITHISVRSHRRQSAHYAFLKLVNASNADMETQVVFDIDDATTKVEPVAIPAGGAWEKTTAFHTPQGGVLRASIDRPDALAADNQAFAILQPIEPVTVRLVTRPSDAFFFQQALLAMDPLINYETSQTLTPEEYEQQRHSTAGLTIFNGYVPQALAGSGQFVFVNAWPKDLPVRTLGTIDRPELSMVNRNHALSQYLNLSAATVAQAHRLELMQRATVLAQAPDGAPLIFLVDQPDRQCLCLAFDVLESDLPFRNAFPILLRNAVSFLVAERTPPIRDQFRLGDVIEPLRPLASDLSEITVAQRREHSVAQHAVAVSGGTFVFDDTATPGPIRFTIGSDVAYTAVNLSDENESRITPVPAAVQPTDRLVLTERVAGFAPWLALAVLATALVGLEWLTYHYRWTE